MLRPLVYRLEQDDVENLGRKCVIWATWRSELSSSGSEWQSQQLTALSSAFAREKQKQHVKWTLMKVSLFYQQISSTLIPCGRQGNRAISFSLLFIFSFSPTTHISIRQLLHICRFIHPRTTNNHFNSSVQSTVNNN